MNELLFSVSVLILTLCSIMCLYRIARGPTPVDRIVGIDILGIVVVCYTVMISLTTRQSFYMAVGISWSVLSFVGTIALAKHLEGKYFDE